MKQSSTQTRNAGTRTATALAALALGFAATLFLSACQNPAADSPKVPPSSITVYAFSSFDSAANVYNYNYGDITVQASPTANPYSTYTITIGGLTDGDVYVVTGENIGSTTAGRTANWNIFTSGASQVITDSGLKYTVGSSGRVTFKFYGSNPSWGSSSDSAQFKIVKADTTITGSTDAPWEPILAGPWKDGETLTNFCIPYSTGYDIAMSFNFN